MECAPVASNAQTALGVVRGGTSAEALAAAIDAVSGL